MISRRAFLKTLAGIAPILGGAGLCLSSPLWERLLAGDRRRLPLRPRSEDRPGPSRPPGRASGPPSPSPAPTAGQCHASPENLTGKRDTPRGRDRQVPPVRPGLRHQGRRARPLPRPDERRRRAQEPRLRPPDHRPHRPDREEALLPLPPRRRGLFAGDLRLPAALQVLPELGDLPGLPGGLRSSAGRPRPDRPFRPGRGRRR